MKVAVWCLVGLAVVSCAAGPTPEEVEAEQQRAMAKRIDEICAMSEPERSKELERLKKEAGLVLYCGKDKD